MFIILLGSIIAFAMVNEFSIVSDREQGDTFYRVAVGQDGQYDQLVNVEPLSVQKFNNVVRQAYDYSCGSAALTTLLDYYLGRNFQERQVMEGLLRFGETERIVQRRGFSLLDMKRLVTALGHPSGGFKAEASDLEELDHPAIAPIEYAGFKHFVVIRTVYEGRVYVADPALGNISFTMSRFLEVWDNNVLFIVFPNGHKPASGLELREEDMRYVSDYIIAENTYKEFPFFQIRFEDLITNQIAQLWNNARSTLEVKLDENGEEVLNEDGNPVLEYKIETEADGLSQEDFNIRYNTTNPNERIEKTLRFRRK
ncbi:C39 family peptidase [Bacterioplanoides sp. SCSIO 12839]|uniref:C39 family peptidase n=1 Tax=Bacterioplanoides sp. SCSIO 12839 TaxID=2829569 RepID=UPI002104DA42|nr:cysteine peptidase family C39 domain-containing protein [Bacterioplanoides sp. SCSIO 12839]UTW46833.1 peptidase C39 [Bacterioplanoides sp. SCSIO 12839]